MAIIDGVGCKVKFLASFSWKKTKNINFFVQKQKTLFLLSKIYMHIRLSSKMRKYKLISERFSKVTVICMVFAESSNVSK